MHALLHVNGPYSRPYHFMGFAHKVHNIRCKVKVKR